MMHMQSTEDRCEVFESWSQILGLSNISDLINYD